MPKSASSDAGGFLWIERGEDRVGPVAAVALVAPVDKFYSFAVPDRLRGKIQPGQRVLVPVGRKGRLRPGFCVACDIRPWESSLKEVDSMIDETSFLTGDLLKLGEWMARYYACPLGRTLAALVPEAVRKQLGFRSVRLVSLTPEGEGILRALNASPDSKNSPPPRLGPKQIAMLTALDHEREPIEAAKLLDKTGGAAATLLSLVKRGWITRTVHKLPSEGPRFDVPLREPEFELNEDQRSALSRIESRIDEGRFSVTLLYGVAGSGKTEVYIRAIRQVLSAGRQAILLVPEIMLTTQIVQRLAARFQNIAVIHSGLAGTARSLLWREIAEGRRPVVIGTRSAVFAPCPNLGLIVIDEEQEQSYKNLRSPRYHARDAAIKRAELLSIPVLLGSATPSLEMWHECEDPGMNSGARGAAEFIRRTVRLELPRRVRQLPLPRVHVVNMEEETLHLGRRVLFSRLWERELSAALHRGEQAMILLNRRGFATWLYCPACKLLLRCPNCSTNMVYHRADNVAWCHYCHHRIITPQACPDVNCGGPLVHRGYGTQRLEEELRRKWPAARVVRADSDTMRHRTHYQRVVDDFEARRTDLLLGTQMIAKGLDFPFVSFVGVLGADRALASSDFRSGERLFQLLSQVAGRAGRGDTGGVVVIQTFEPSSHALEAAIQHDYRAFAESELPVRRLCHYPPFSQLVRFVVADPRQDKAELGARSLVERIGDHLDRTGRTGISLSGPLPCILERLRGNYRFEALLRFDTRDLLERTLTDLRGRGVLARTAKSLTIDVDPTALT